MIVFLFLNVCAVSADDSFNFTNDEVNVVQIFGEDVIYKGTDEMEFPDANELNVDNFTNKFFNWWDPS